MSLMTRDTDTNPATNSLSSNREDFTDKAGIVAASAEVDSNQSGTPKEIFKVIPGIKTTKVFQNYYVDEIESDMQGRASKEQKHRIE